MDKKEMVDYALAGRHLLPGCRYKEHGEPCDCLRQIESIIQMIESLKKKEEFLQNKSSNMPPSSKIVARSPETIIQEFNSMYPYLEMAKGIDETKAIRHLIKSALASVIVWASEEAKPNPKQLVRVSNDRQYWSNVQELNFRQDGINDYESSLQALAKQITE